MVLVPLVVGAMIDAAVLGLAGLRADLADDVLTITLDRAETHNAQTPAMWSALAAIGRDAPGTVRFVVVRGAGPSFSSGLDTALLASSAGTAAIEGIGLLPEDKGLALIAEYQSAFSWLTRPDIVSIAAVRGHAIGAGFQLALACDLRIAADDAAFAMPEGTRGLVPDLGGTRPLVRTIGYARALELCLTGRRVGAEEARQCGLVNLVVRPADLDAAVADCVSALRATSRGASAEIKALLQAALGQSAEEQLASEREGQLRRLKDGLAMGD